LNGAHDLQSFAFMNGGKVATIVFNLSQTAALPVTFSGANAPTGNVEVSQITSAKITDNNETSNVVQPTTKTLSGFNASTVVSLPPFSMTVFTAASSAVQAPVLSVPAGTYSTAQSVAISDTTSGAKIYYTTNGTTPSASSTLYSGPVTISSSKTLQAIATASGLGSSAVTSAAYVIGNVTAATPTFSVPAGTYGSAQTVTLADATSGASIYYTTNGTTPTTSSTKYTAAIKVGASETIKAIAAGTNINPSAVATATYAITATTATPTFSVAAGTYASVQTVTLKDATSGAVIYYTTNGSTPTTSSTKYAAAIKVSATETIKAIAVAPNFAASAVATATYTISAVAAAPKFSVAAGTYTTAQKVALTDTTPGAVIYYGINGKNPAKYTTPITVSASETIQAIAQAPGYGDSAGVSATYTIVTATTATPTFSVAAGTYAAAQTVVLADKTSGAVIYYTTNGSTPTTASAKYTVPLKVTVNETIKAIAVAANLKQSAVATAAYVISPLTATPKFSVAAGKYTSVQTVALSDATAGAVIYYTVNGTTPTIASTKYTAPIKVSASETIKVIAKAASYQASAVASAVYTLDLTTAAPKFSVVAGTYTTAQKVALSDSTPGAVIYYGINAKNPTKYTTPITVSVSETIQAIAQAPGYSASAGVSAAYTIMTKTATAN
jgi:hypothetical protein